MENKLDIIYKRMSGIRGGLLRDASTSTNRFFLLIELKVKELIKTLERCVRR